MYAERASIKKKKRHPHTVTNWLFVQTTHVALSESKFACRVASGVYSSINQVLLKTVQWFCRCGWSKIALSHYFGHWLIQQAVIIILFYYYYCCFYLLFVIAAAAAAVIYRGVVAFSHKRQSSSSSCCQSSACYFHFPPVSRLSHYQHQSHVSLIIYVKLEHCITSKFL